MMKKSILSKIYYTKDSETLDAKEEFALDVIFLQRVLKTPIFVVKSIPPNCRLAFSQTLKNYMYKLVAELGSVRACVQLLFLSRCTLQVVKPQNMTDKRFGNQKSFIQHHILKCLDIWRYTYDLTKLVDILLDNSGQDGLVYDRVHIEEDDKNMGANIR